jgi:hypothetical protein
MNTIGSQRARLVETPEGEVTLYIGEGQGLGEKPNGVLGRFAGYVRLFFC